MLEPATLERMAAGLARFGGDPVLVPSGGTWNTEPTPVGLPCRTRTTVETEGIACPPEGPKPFMLRLRGGGDRQRAHAAQIPIGTVSAQGEHHALVTSAGARHMVMSYYGNGGCTPSLVPLPTQPTKDRFALVSTTAEQVEDCTFRMLHPRSEITPAMGFPLGYTLFGTRSEQVAQLGNAVTCNAARLLADRLGAAVLGERVA
jgi:DNA (cytosine-5)-methyltransferase 1